MSVPPEPYIPAEAELPEFTVRAVVAGTLLGMVFVLPPYTLCSRSV